MSLASVCGVELSGLGEGEAAAMMERGGRMLKIWSSDGCWPYESKGSGTDCSMGSMTGSELERASERTDGRAYGRGV